MKREGTFNAYAKGNLADGESLRDPVTLAGDDDALEDLDTGTVTFNNLHVNLYVVTRTKRGDAFTH